MMFLRNLYCLISQDIYDKYQSLGRYICKQVNRKDENNNSKEQPYTNGKQKSSVETTETSPELCIRNINLTLNDWTEKSRVLSIKPNPNPKEFEELQNLSRNLSLVKTRFLVDRGYACFKKILLILLVLCLARTTLWNNSKTFQKLTKFILRKAEIKLLLPVWDWRPWYHRSCLIYNPNYDDSIQDHQLTIDDCQVCIDVKSISAFDKGNISESIVVDLLKRDEPFFVTDGTVDWPSFNPESENKIKELSDLDKFYYNSNDLEFSHSCSLKTNLKTANYGVNKRRNGRMMRNDIFSAITGPDIKDTANNNPKKIYAYWQNCEKRAAKAFRKLMRRPYYIPGMAEGSSSNWLFLSKHYRALEYIRIPVRSKTVWWAQILGKTEIRIVPKHPCSRYCQDLFLILNLGNIVYWNENLWDAYYKPLNTRLARKLGGFEGENGLEMFYDPLSENETLAIASGLNWN